MLAQVLALLALLGLLLVLASFVSFVTLVDDLGVLELPTAGALSPLETISFRARWYSKGKTLTNFSRDCAQVSSNSRARLEPVQR